MKIANKVVLITGASEGIGAACAHAFHEKGARISLSCLPGPDFPRPDGALVTEGDITDHKVREDLVRRTVERFGTVDILVNNAGVGLYKPPSSAPLELVRRLFEVNVFAPLGLAQLAIPHMKGKDRGMIINMGSVGGYASLPWASMYCASKFALHAVSDSLRRELSRNGIHVMKVAPGIVDTKFRDHVLGGTAPGKVSDIKRLVSPEQVAEAVLKGVERNARTVFVPWLSRPFTALELMFPGLMDAYVRSKW